MGELKWHIRRQEAMCATETKAGGVIGLWGLQTCTLYHALNINMHTLETDHCSPLQHNIAPPSLHSVTPGAGSEDILPKAEARRLEQWKLASKELCSHVQ